MGDYKENQLILGFSEDARERHDHLVDTVNLLVFTFLLICVIITIWVFKHKRLPYVHETGLAILYGTIFGFIIRYGFKHENRKVINLIAENLTLKKISDLPSIIYMNVPNMTEKFAYGYKNPIRARTHNSTASQDFREKATFDPEIFFNILLPPIIFNAGYSMKRRHFFKNFGAILTFSLLGTVISCLFFGGFMYIVISVFRSIKSYFSFSDCLLFGAVISATDPVTILAIFQDQQVNVNLYALIFGESILNDASSIILLQTIERYNSNVNSDKFDIHEFFSCIYNFMAVFWGSLGIGSLMGCVNALITKFTLIKNHALLETALFILMSYSTFLISEATGLTGIVSLLFCGVFQAHYTFNNLSTESQVNTKQIFNLLNFLSENFIFIYIGITLVTFGEHKWEFFFIFFSLIGIVLARALNIYPLAYVINYTRSTRNKITRPMQHLMFFAGLRGAMAFALAIRNTSTEARKLMLTTTSVIVTVTVLLGGGLTNRMIDWLGIKPNSTPMVDNDDNNNNRNNSNNNNGETPLEDRATSSTGMSGFERQENEPKYEKVNKIINKIGIFRAWHNFDNNVMKPFLTHSRPNLMETMPQFCLPVTKWLTTKEQLGLNPLVRSNSHNSLDSAMLQLDLKHTNDDDDEENSDSLTSSHQMLNF